MIRLKRTMKKTKTRTKTRIKTKMTSMNIKSYLVKNGI